MIMGQNALKWVRQLDSILRGQATQLPALREGVINISARGISVVLLVLGMIYGVCMGLFSVIDSGGTHYLQLLATTVKVPMLFFLTLLVTLPSLYVFNALVGSRLTLHSVVRLLVAAQGVMLAVLASFGTIVGFFSVSTKSYAFMILLNVAVFAISGVLGLRFLLQTLHRLALAQEPPAAPPTAGPTDVPSSWAEQWKQQRAAVATPAPDAATGAPAPSEPTAPSDPGSPPRGLSPLSPSSLGALDRATPQEPGHNVKTVFEIWIVVFALVGAQMGWILRPFIGNPNMPFTWFRPRTGNFFEAVWGTLRHLIGG